MIVSETWSKWKVELLPRTIAWSCARFKSRSTQTIHEGAFSPVYFGNWHCQTLLLTLSPLRPMIGLLFVKLTPKMLHTIQVMYVGTGMIDFWHHDRRLSCPPRELTDFDKTVSWKRNVKESGNMQIARLRWYYRAQLNFSVTIYKDCKHAAALKRKRKLSCVGS